MLLAVHRPSPPTVKRADLHTSLFCHLRHLLASSLNYGPRMLHRGMLQLQAFSAFDPNFRLSAARAKGRQHSTARCMDLGALAFLAFEMIYVESHMLSVGL